MSNDDKSLGETIDKYVRYRLHGLHTASPAKVTAYDPITNTCTAKPMLQTAILDENEEIAYEDWEEIPFVPVCFPRAGDYIITFPLTEGDTVLLVFSESSTAEWHDANASTQPADLRRHSGGYPFAIPGAYPGGAMPLSSDSADVAARNAGIVLGQHAGENRIEISSSGIKLGKSAVDFVALASAVLIELNKIKATLLTGTSVSGGAVTFGTPYSPGSVAASETKAK